MRMTMRLSSLLALCSTLLLAACGGKVAGQGNDDAGPGVDSGTSGKDGGTAVDSGVIVKDGGVVPADGGPPPPPPPPPLCGSKQGTGYAGSDGSCGSDETWSCGSVAYEIDCSCPSAYCVCKKNQQIVGKVTYAACPACNSMVGVAGACGFPE